MNAGLIRVPQLAALLASLLVAVASSATEEASADLQAGIEAFNRGDLPGAMVLYEKAAEAGLPEAQARLGFLLDHAEDNDAAVRWYRAAAAQDYPPGVAGLAGMYAKGEGVRRDPAQARKLFEKAAEAGHLPSIRVLIAAYENGGLDVARDEAKLAYWKGRQASFDVGRDKRE
jgi:TPR repeat protein